MSFDLVGMLCMNPVVVSLNDIIQTSLFNDSTEIDNNFPWFVFFCFGGVGVFPCMMCCVRC